MDDINRHISKTISGDNIIKVLKSFQETEWIRCGPVIKEFEIHEDVEKEPHFTGWRWKNPDPQLDGLIIEAVNSFKGQIEWEIDYRNRRHSLGGRNWGIEPKRKREFYNKHEDLDGLELANLIKEKEPEIGILSNRDVPQLAEHIKRYVEERRTPW